MNEFEKNPSEHSFKWGRARLSCSRNHHLSSGGVARQITSLSLVSHYISVTLSVMSLEHCVDNQRTYKQQT